MLPEFARRPAATGAAFCFVAVVVACGEANKPPFFDTNASSVGGGSGTAQGGVSGTGTGGVAVGGDAGAGIGGSATGGTAGDATGGDAGISGTSGNAGSGAMGGTGSGGSAGASSGGTSGTIAGGTGGSGGSAVDCGGADPAAVAFESHCYVLRTTPRTWMAARADCSADGAHLVTIESDDRNEAAFEAENQFVWTLGGAAEVWIGATDGRQSNQAGNGTPYSWITGESIVPYDRWSAGQPNNSPTDCMDGAPCTCGDTCWEHCGFMWDPENDEPATWNDRHCEHLIGYVCEWDEPPM